MAKLTDFAGNRPMVGIPRTDRAYVYDLCDHYNANMSAEARHRGAQWYVGTAGELKLGDNAEWARHHAKQIERSNESERARYNRIALENAR